MEFNKLVKDRLCVVLDKYNYQLSDERKNVLCFESPTLQIRFIFDERDLSLLVQLVAPKNIIISLTDYLIKNALGLDLKLQKVTQEVFFRRCRSYFLTCNTSGN